MKQSLSSPLKSPLRSPFVLAGTLSILDQLSVAPAVAYSLRKLRTAYTGSAIRVRRSLDNAERDIGFNGTNLDTTALQNFVGSQNVLLHSDGLFTSPWIAGPAHTRTSNADIAPNGTTTATRITNTNSTTGNFTYQLQSTVTGQRTFSVYGKAETNRYLWIYNGVSVTTSYGVLFDLQNGVVVLSNTIGAVTSASSSIQSVGNGWYRCSITHTQATSAYVAVTATNNTSPTFSANNDITNCTAGTMLVWGAQFNQGALQPYSSTTTTARDGNGFVPAWYDQSVNGYHITQTTAANQPAIVTGGVMVTLNNRPAVDFSGTKWLFNTAVSGNSALWGNNPQTMNMVGRSSVTTDRDAFSLLGGAATTTNLRSIGGSPGTAWRYTAGTDAVAPVPTADLSVVTGVYADSVTTLYTQGVLRDTEAGLENTTAGNLTIGARTSVGTIPWLGLATEFTLFPSVLSTADRQTLERNQGTYFGITVA